jgi:hypothetical protein
MDKPVLDKYSISVLMLFFALLSCANTFAGEADRYFPLALGNTWIFQGNHYRFTENNTPILIRVDTLTVKVAETREINGLPGITSQERKDY